MCFFSITKEYKQQYSDAMGEMANSKQQLEEGKQLFLDLANAGYSIGPSLQAAGLNLGDIGITADVIGQQVASGMMTAEEAAVFFENIPKIARKIQTLCDVGLGYVKLGQPATTLSGGEAQRVKLATELSKRATGRTIYILDEPTTGLHAADVHKLIEVLQTLVDSGNTVVVIEHNLDVIKTADYIIDLGPEGGDRGGQIVATGTPDQVAQCEGSYTGKYLKKVLEKAQKQHPIPPQ